MKPRLLPLIALLALLSCQQGNPTEPPVPPSATALTAALLNDETARLSWTKSPDMDFLRYRLYRDSSPGVQQNPNQAVILMVSENRNQNVFIDEGLQQGYWYYAVLVENNAGLTTWSNEASVHVQNRSE